MAAEAVTPPTCSAHDVTPHAALAVSLLTEILDVQRRILAALEQRRTPYPLTRADRMRLAPMLPAIAGALGSEPFTSRDLVADDAAPALRVVCGTLSIKQIGRLLARAEATPIDGWLVERCGVEINVTLWRIVRAVSHD
jgi:hypothetical protein